MTEGDMALIRETARTVVHEAKSEFIEAIQLHTLQCPGAVLGKRGALLSSRLITVISTVVTGVLTALIVAHFITSRMEYKNDDTKVETERPVRSANRNPLQ